MEILESLENGRVFIIREMLRHSELLRLSEEYPGVFYTNRHTITQVVGNETRVYIPITNYDEIVRTRKIVAALTGYDLDKVKWGYPAMARQISEWYGYRQKPLSYELARFVLPHWHFQECVPCILETGKVIDMKGAYWQIASRAKSLNCRIIPETREVVWGTVPPDVERKWEASKAALSGCKKLRLTIIGVNSLGWKGRETCELVYYRKGVAEPLTGKPPTMFQPLSILTVRAAYELTQLQCDEIGAMYANADSILLDGTRKAGYWADFGIEYRTVASGAVDVAAIGAWKVGNEEKLTYKFHKERNSYEYKKSPRLDNPSYHLYLQN